MKKLLITIAVAAMIGMCASFANAAHPTIGNRSVTVQIGKQRSVNPHHQTARTNPHRQVPQARSYGHSYGHSRVGVYGHTGIIYGQRGVSVQVNPRCYHPPVYYRPYYYQPRGGGIQIQTPRLQFGFGW